MKLSKCERQQVLDAAELIELDLAEQVYFALRDESGSDGLSTKMSAFYEYWFTYEYREFESLTKDLRVLLLLTFAEIE